MNVIEEKEPAAFWEALGGKGDYAKATGSLSAYDMPSLDLIERQKSQHREPRLFQASNNRGYFYCEEITHFDQTVSLVHPIHIKLTQNRISLRMMS